MRKFSLYVGIDVSKAWLDMAVVSQQNELVKTERIDNSSKAIREFLRSLGKSDRILFCMENTGRYGNAFLEITATKRLNTWVEHPLQIKRTQGMVRGKTDELDAMRIAQYALRFQDKANLWKPEEKIISKLRELQSKRDLLVKSYKMIKQADEESDSDLQQPLTALQKVSLSLMLRLKR